MQEGEEAMFFYSGMAITIQFVGNRWLFFPTGNGGLVELHEPPMPAGVRLFEMDELACGRLPILAEPDMPITR